MGGQGMKEASLDGDEGWSISPTYSKGTEPRGKSLKLLGGKESDAQGKEERKEKEKET
mgnify:CR=1 FL=1